MNAETSTIAGQLLDKLKSKMDVAKFFAGIVALVIGLIPMDRPLHASAKYGMTFLIGSIVFALAALVTFDRLLMPPKYWTVDVDALTHESSLKRGMVRAWFSLFCPSIALFLLGMVLVLVEPLGLPTFDVFGATVATWVFALLLVNVLVPFATGAVVWATIYQPSATKGRGDWPRLSKAAREMISDAVRRELEALSRSPGDEQV